MRPERLDSSRTRRNPSFGCGAYVAGVDVIQSPRSLGPAAPAKSPPANRNASSISLTSSISGNAGKPAAGGLVSRE